MVEPFSPLARRARSSSGRQHLPEEVAKDRSEELAKELAGEITKDRNKSRITNGKMMPGIDGRSAYVRRCRDILAEHVADLGGVGNTTAALRSIARRAAVLGAELELLEAQFATAGQATADQLDLYTRTASALRRLLESIGLERRAKNITPSLSDYLDGKAEAAE